MDRLNGSARLMIVSDLDSTLVDHDDQENISLLSFNALWESCYRHDSLLVFSTGRSPTSYQKLRKEKPLLTPDIIIMSLGTEIAYGQSMVWDDKWEQHLNHKWDRDIVLEETSKFHELVPKSETKQRPHMISFFIEKSKASATMKALSERLEKRGHAAAGALNVQVSNAKEELLQWYEQNANNNPNIIHATERCADGIIQAIGNFGLGPNVSPRDIRNFQKCKVDIFSPGHQIVKFYLFYERWRRAEVQKSDHYMQKLRLIFDSVGIFVHPSGIEQSLHQSIDVMARLYGDKQGKQYRVWVDRVSLAQIGSDAWLVKFDKWELSGVERHCCLTTVLLNSKAMEPDGFTWMHMHQTWLEGSGPVDQTTWVL